MKESEISVQTTPGAILKKARVAQGLTVNDVASRLCLSVQFIEDIEKDDYSRMSAQTYARGYVVSYAHMLGIADADILPAFSNLKIHFEPSKSTVSLSNEDSSPVYQSMESSQQRSSAMMWGSIIALIIVLGLLIMWWQGPRNAHSKVDNDITSQEQPATEIPLQPDQPQSQPAPSQPSSSRGTAPAPQNLPPSSSQSRGGPQTQPQPTPNQSSVQPSDVSSNSSSQTKKAPQPNVDLPEPRDTGNNE